MKDANGATVPASGYNATWTYNKGPAGTEAISSSYVGTATVKVTGKGGWTGTATFTEVLSEDSGGQPADNSSAPTDTGVAPAATVQTQVDSDLHVQDSPLRQLLQRAGIGLP